MVKEFIEEHSNMLTKDFQKLLQEQVDEYAKKISEINTLEELDEKEKEIIAEMEEYDKYINAYEYKLPEYVNFEGKKVSLKEIRGKFIYFITNFEINWELVPTMYELCRIWKQDNITSVTHGVLDSTIRILGKLKFRGYSEIRDMKMLDMYFDPIIESYGKHTSYQIAMGHRHNEIMKRRTLLTPKSEQEYAVADPDQAPVM